MCILCPIKVLLPTSHVFNRFMFSICDASSHIQSCLLHVQLPLSRRTITRGSYPRNLPYHLIVWSSVGQVPHSIQQSLMHFLDVPSWSHPVHLGIRDQNREMVAKNTYPRADCQTLMKDPFIAGASHNLQICLSFLRILTTTTTPPTCFPILLSSSLVVSLCLSKHLPCTAIGEEK